MKTLAIFLCLFAATSLAGQIDAALDEQGLKEVKIPTGIDLKKANHSSNEFCIEKPETKIIIRKSNKTCTQQEQSITLNGYSFLGINNGEFGGSFSVKYPGGTDKTLIKDNVIKIIRTPDGLYVFTGLAHLTMSRGAVYRVSLGSPSIFVERVTLLPEAPNAIVALDGSHSSFLIVTASGLFKLDIESDTLQSILMDQFWEQLYPNSAAFNSGQLMIGMRSGIAVVTLGAGNKAEKVRYFSK